MTLGVIIGYLCLVILVGTSSHRLFRKTGEDYFVASRSIGPFVLLMSLFGTNMTAFAILGASGKAYDKGIGVYALLASPAALVMPAIFFFVGTRLWRLGKRHGYLTQIQYFRDRFQSNHLGLLLFIVLVTLLIPYLMIGVMGAGLTFSQMTDGQVPYWLGTLIICSVVFFYVTYSGMRGTAMVNTFQTLVFMTLGGITILIILNKLGGLDAAISTLAETKPELLIRGDQIAPLYMLSYTMIPLSVAMFPHIFTHWLTAKKASNFRYPIIFYPICLAIVWVPSILLGVLGHIDFPGLVGPDMNSVLVRMVDKHAAGFVGGLLAAGVIAAIMSSLDSQVLTVGNMFTQDIVGHYKIGGEMDEKRQVLFGRLFVCCILGIIFGLSLVMPRSIFKLAIWSFSGFAALTPLIFGALFWKRATKVGCYAAIISTVLTWIYFFSQGSQTLGDTDIMVVVVLFAVSSLTMVVGSLLSKPPTNLDKFFKGI